MRTLSVLLCAVALVGLTRGQPAAETPGERQEEEQLEQAAGQNIAEAVDTINEIFHPQTNEDAERVEKRSWRDFHEGYAIGAALGKRHLQAEKESTRAVNSRLFRFGKRDQMTDVASDVKKRHNIHIYGLGKRDQMTDVASDVRKRGWRSFRNGAVFGAALAAGKREAQSIDENSKRDDINWGHAAAGYLLATGKRSAEEKRDVYLPATSPYPSGSTWSLRKRAETTGVTSDMDKRGWRSYLAGKREAQPEVEASKRHIDWYHRGSVVLKRTPEMDDQAALEVSDEDSPEEQAPVGDHDRVERLGQALNVLNDVFIAAELADQEKSEVQDEITEQNEGENEEEEEANNQE